MPQMAKTTSHPATYQAVSTVFGRFWTLFDAECIALEAVYTLGSY